MLEDAGVGVVLTQGELETRCQVDFGGRTVLIWMRSGRGSASESESEPESEV